MASQYETDFYGWTQEQSGKLRKLLTERSNLDIDLENIAEEIDSMGRSDRRQLVSRLGEIDNHLMKLAFSLAWEPRQQWKNSVQGQRRGIGKLLKDSPSLKPQLDDALVEAHEDALRYFDEAKLIQLNMPETLPVTCPFELDQMLDLEWWPDPRGEQ